MQFNSEEMHNFTGNKKFNAIYTVTLAELIERKIFDWNSLFLNWKEYAYSEEQYHRFCKYFEMRFYYREISIIPFKEWALRLKAKLCYELMPKYKPLYERFGKGINPLQDSDNYSKERIITSDYPQTLLSENSDYASTGKDSETENLQEGNLSNEVSKYVEKMESIDQLIGNELESMFISLYTVSMNVL